MEASPDGTGSQIDELRRMLERELKLEARPLTGCWPLLVALAGLLLGVVLLLGVR